MKAKLITIEVPDDFNSPYLLVPIPTKEGEVRGVRIAEYRRMVNPCEFEFGGYRE